MFLLLSLRPNTKNNFKRTLFLNFLKDHSVGGIIKLTEKTENSFVRHIIDCVRHIIDGYMSIFRRFVIPTWEIRLNKLNKLKLNKLIAMSE